MTKFLLAIVTALKPLLLSKKFQAAVATTLVNCLFYFGIEVSLEVTLGITTPFMLMIAGQTAVDVRKAGASTSSAALVLLASIGLGAGVMGAVGCGAAQRATASFIDCMKPNTAALAHELTGMVGDAIRHATDNTGRVDWASVKGVVSTFKSDAPMCAFRAALVEAMRPRSSGGVQAAGLEYSVDDLRAGFAEINREVFGARLEPLP